MNFDMIISIDENINDPLLEGDVSIVNQVLSIARQVTESGRKVEVQRQYSNSVPDIIETFTTPEQIDEWRDRLNKVQKILGRENIS